jgi:hypothetical protein
MDYNAGKEKYMQDFGEGMSWENSCLNNNEWRSESYIKML